MNPIIIWGFVSRILATSKRAWPVIGNVLKNGSEEKGYLSIARILESQEDYSGALEQYETAFSINELCLEAL